MTTNENYSLNVLVLLLWVASIYVLHSIEFYLFIFTTVLKSRWGKWTYKL